MGCASGDNRAQMHLVVEGEGAACSTGCASSWSGLGAGVLGRKAAAWMMLLRATGRTLMDAELAGVDRDPKAEKKKAMLSWPPSPCLLPRRPSRSAQPGDSGHQAAVRAAAAPPTWWRVCCSPDLVGAVWCPVANAPDGLIPGGGLE